MTQDQRPEGRYFHEVYLPLAPMQDDSRSFRVKYAYMIRDLDKYEVSASVIGETAIETFKPDPSVSPGLKPAIMDLNWYDLLKVIHAIVRYLRRYDSARVRDGLTAAYIKGVQGLFVSERLNWEMDDKGGIHPLKDTAYSMQRQSIIVGLSKPRFANAAAAMQRFVESYEAIKPDNKAAINHVFDAAEHLFKLRYQPKPPDRLVPKTAALLHKQFPRPTEQYEDDSHLKKANSAMIDSFVSWVEACQQYRHEQGIPDVVEQPPNELTELLVTAGMSFVRWLVRIDPGQ